MTKMGLNVGVKIAKAGNRIMAFIAAILVIVSLSYGSYSLWDAYMTYKGAFLSEELLKYKPVENGTGYNPTLLDLKNVNKETVAWITVDNTHIDYPVLRAKDNAKYVNTDIYENFSLSGSIFLSYENSPDFSDSYNLLFGHHMANGGMFGDVAKFTKRDFFEKHRKGMLFTENETYDIEFFAIMNTVAYDYTVYYPGKFKTNGDTPELLSYIKDKSMIFEDCGFQGDYKIIALSTCEDATTNGRTVLFGKMIKKNYVDDKLGKGDDDTKTLVVEKVQKKNDMNKAEEEFHWALFNLICMIITIVIYVIMFINRHKIIQSIKDNIKEEKDDNKQREDETVETEEMTATEYVDDEREKRLKHIEKYEKFLRKKRKIMILQIFAGAFVSVASIVTFILTENIFEPMILFDKWSLLMFILLIINGVIYLSKGKRRIK